MGGLENGGRYHPPPAATSATPCERRDGRFRPSALTMADRWCTPVRVDPADSLAVAGFFVGVGGHRVMAKKVKKEKPKKGFNIFDEDESAVTSSEEELPKDEAGRRKIKRQYEDLLGIRIQKLRGRILNRERINKTIEGIYFICAECA
jgi:hypothetical protein